MLFINQPTTFIYLLEYKRRTAIKNTTSKKYDEFNNT